VRAALSEALQAPRDDPTVRLAEYPREQFLLPYPDRHSDRYTLVEVTMFAGRLLDTKRRLYDAIVQRLATLGVSFKRCVDRAARAADGELGRLWGYTGERSRCRLQGRHLIASPPVLARCGSDVCTVV
jgi:Tautomerase enzyme